MSWWWRCVLLVPVCAAHISVFFVFNSAPRSLPTRMPRSASVYSMLQYTIPDSNAEGRRQSSYEPERARSVTSVEPSHALQPRPHPDERSISSATFSSTGDQDVALDIGSFLEADAVDETARAEDRFEEILKQSLPLGLQAIELELWIDHTGNTVLVRCLDQDNCGDPADGLKQLLTLRFSPAIKDGISVSSRKHISIHIDPPPTFGL